MAEVNPHMSVRDNISFGLRPAKTDPAEIDRRVKSAADILELTALLDRKPKQLSGGQRQRVAIGRAIVRDPVPCGNRNRLCEVAAKLQEAYTSDSTASPCP